MVEFIILRNQYRLMKITVITPSFNQGHFIERTIQSILSQEFDGELEYLVIDGGSTDNTLDILKGHGGRIEWVSEKDNGLADAVNKGLAMASGDIIGWLNSDDLYRPGTLATVLEYFAKNPDCMWLYGKCRIIDLNDREIYKSVTRYKNLLLKKYSYSRLLKENYISQPAVFFRRSLIDEVGKLRTDLRFALDYDLWLRFGRRYPAAVIPWYLSDFRRHPQSLSETNTARQFEEQYNVAREHGASRLQLGIHKFNVKKILCGYRVLSALSR
jgi:glycosyltransferase involved in cell wall biosynthesis